MQAVLSSHMCKWMKLNSSPKVINGILLNSLGINNKWAL